MRAYRRQLPLNPVHWNERVRPGLKIHRLAVVGHPDKFHFVVDIGGTVGV